MCYDRALQEPLKSRTVLFKTIFKVAFVLNSHFRFLFPDSPSPTPGVEANQNPPWGGETSCYVKQVLLPVGTVTWLTGYPGCEVLVCVFCSSFSCHMRLFMSILQRFSIFIHQEHNSFSQGATWEIRTIVVGHTT